MILSDVYDIRAAFDRGEPQAETLLHNAVLRTSRGTDPDAEKLRVVRYLYEAAEAGKADRARVEALWQRRGISV